eukprot:2475238-Amphidinium_carterae.1
MDWLWSGVSALTYHAMLLHTVAHMAACTPLNQHALALASSLHLSQTPFSLVRCENRGSFQSGA